MPKAEAEAILELGRPQQTPTNSATVAPSALDSDVHIELYDPVTDRRVLRELAVWCRRYTPGVGLEESSAPDCLLMNITGTTHLYGNERAMARRVLTELREHQLHARVAVASTTGTAWAVAHYGTGNRRQEIRRDIPLIVPPGDERRTLSNLPPAALRLPDEVIEVLNELNLRQLQQLFDLPRTTLPSRFGDILHQRVDQALGLLAETITPVAPARPAIVRREFDFPISHRRAIEITVEQLLGRAIKIVQPRRHGILRLCLRLHTESKETTEVTIGLIRPSVSVAHLLQLTRTRLERVQTPGDIDEICIEITASAPLAPRQETLFACRDEAGAMRERELLLERISNRLGEDAVVRANPVADAQPERAFRFEPLTRVAVANFDSKPAHSNSEPTPSATAAPCVVSQRPVKVLVHPHRIDVLSTTDDGAPASVRWDSNVHSIVQTWGPERIHTGWWRDNNIVRDYYRVETARGQRLWVFRNRLSGHWYLHGTFD